MPGASMSTLVAVLPRGQPGISRPDLGVVRHRDRELVVALGVGLQPADGERNPNANENSTRVPGQEKDKK
jgi:hypothetical protein